MYTTFFKKRNKITPVTIEKKETVTVKEIHTAFNEEVIRLLESCNIKIAEDINEELIKKQKRLERLGFDCTSISEKAEEEIKKSNKIEQINKKNKEIVEAIKYFQVKYPMYKFITKESVEKLCEKYGLVYGPVDCFIGNVPDKNIEDMEKFHIDDEDKAYHSRFKDLGYTNYQSAIGHREAVMFEIVAPITDFDVDSLKLNKFKLERKPVVKDDPIVLQAIRFANSTFYLIVTAWGEEASDELVLNPKHN